MNLHLQSATRRYGAILADPPWPFDTWSERGRDRCPDAKQNGRPERHYRTMPVSEIMALPVADFAARDCVLFLWCVDSRLPDALRVGEAWGFTYKTKAFCWIKTGVRVRHPMGLGHWTRSNPEDCWLFTRGRPRRLDAGVPKLIEAPRREHSRKPDEVYDPIERLVAGPYLELFARTSRPGWDAWGQQVGRWIAPAALRTIHDPQIGLAL